MKKVKVCGIGCGGMASGVHYPSLAEMKDVELAGLSELSVEKAKAGVEKFGFRRTYTDYRQMLEKEKPDVVYMMLPPTDVFPVLAHCLSNGLHVFSEKPPAMTTYQTTVLVEMIKKKKNITQIGYQRKYVPLVTRMRQLVEQRGPIDQFTVAFHKNMGNPPAGYYGGAIDILTCDASHMLDAMLWLGGSDPVKVMSIVRDSYVDNKVRYNALVLFEKGVSGFFSANWNSGRRFLEMEIHGQGCVARTDVENIGAYYDLKNPNGITVTAQEAAGSDKPHRVSGFFAQARDFIDCVKKGQKPRGCLENALKTMRLIDQVYVNSA